MYIQTTYHPLKRGRAVGVSANLPELVSYKISVQGVLDHSHISIELLGTVHEDTRNHVAGLMS